MAGSLIEGYWRWFSNTGARHARRFASRDAAIEDTPNLKGLTFLGNRIIMRVAFAPAEGTVAPWSYDTPEVFPGPETSDEYLDRVQKELQEKEKKDG
jgi:hypothetical protein